MKLGTYILLAVALTTVVLQGDDHSTADAKESVVWAPPQFWYPKIFPKPTVPKELVGHLRVGNVNILLEETPIKDVQAHLGGVIGHRGDAAEYLEWVCVHGSDEIGQWVLWIEGGEIHGGTVGGFRWQRATPSARFDNRCAVLPKTDDRITLPISVGLGTTETDLFQALGKPTTMEGDNLLFAHEHDETIRGEPYTSDNNVSIFLRRGVVWAMQVWKTTVS